MGADYHKSSIQVKRGMYYSGLGQEAYSFSCGFLVCLFVFFFLLCFFEKMFFHSSKGFAGLG